MTNSLDSTGNQPSAASDRLILEGVVTTLNEDGTVNASPMGPVVDRGLTQMTLKPFSTSRTCQNLLRCPEGVVHVTDDVELIAAAAIGKLESIETRPAKRIRGQVLGDACRAYEFRIVDVDDSQERVVMRAELVERTFLREFFGFNRAKHAVLEAAILATRLAFLPRSQIMEEMRRLESPVMKTAGEQERRAFELLQQYVAEQATERSTN